MEYWVGVDLTIASSDEAKLLKEEISNIQSRGRSLGYKVSINNKKQHLVAKDKDMNIDILFPDEIGMRSNWRVSIWLLFETPIDREKLKPIIDINAQVPSNIVSDFEGFTSRYRMPSRDKQELINIIKRGNWS
jgi:hypothetical protein